MLSKQRQKANTSVNIALRVLQQVAEEEKQEKRDLEQHLDGGLVISELSEFVGTLTGKSVLDEQVSEPKVRVPSMPSIQDNNSPLEMDVDQDQSLQHVQQGVEEEEGQVSEADQEADVILKFLDSPLSNYSILGLFCTWRWIGGHPQVVESNRRHQTND